jgi:tRNA threonylcarbamoyladenosine biosynthesis protein TsaE
VILRLRSGSPEDTFEIARLLGLALAPGDVVALTGDLGAGKTTFVRGMAPAFGIDPEAVSSPTFALIQAYAGSRGTLHHADLYRLDADEVADLGLLELVESGVLVVEWAERWPDPPDDAIHVWIEDLGGDRRRISLQRGAARDE